MTINLRRAGAGDAAAIASVIAAVWDDTPAEPARIAAAAGRGDHMGWVALDDVRVCGFLDGFVTRSPEGLRRWELDLIAVRPEAQGRGAATALVTAALAALREQDVVRALVRVDNTGMQAVMRRTGFSLTGGAHVLMVAGGADDQSDGDLDCVSLSFVDVCTLTYSGVWVEVEQATAQLNAARVRVKRLGLDVAGAVIPLANAASLAAAEAAGYGRIGEYEWWTKTL
jgi:ribosomal protein S18 acetylase RimI-like enzyme